MIPLVHADLRAGACRRWAAALDTPHADRLARARRRVAHMPALDRETVAKLIAETPPPLPDEREGEGWTVYRIVFADGAAYVGITSGSVAHRLAEHLGVDDAFDFHAPAIQDRTPVRGSAQVLRRAAAGIAYRFRVLGSGLDEWQARALEDAAIRRLKRPLNRTANARRWRDPVTRDLAGDPARGSRRGVSSFWCSQSSL